MEPRWFALALGVVLLVLPRPSASQTSPSEWDPAAYLAEIEQAESAAALATGLPESSDAQRQAWFESAGHRQTARDMLRTWLHSVDPEEVPEEYLAAARDDLASCHRNVVSSLTNAGYCGLAETALRLYASDIAITSQGPSPELSARVDGCRPGRADDEATELSEPGDDLIEADESLLAAAPAGRPRAGWALFGLAGASALGALAWDRALADEMSEYDRIIGGCSDGGCDRARGRELERPLSAGRIGVATLLGVGVVSGVVGAILATGSRSSDSPAGAVLRADGGAGWALRF